MTLVTCKLCKHIIEAINNAKKGEAMKNIRKSEQAETEKEKRGKQVKSVGKLRIFFAKVKVIYKHLTWNSFGVVFVWI